jgi:LuxR family maltose regulon positive regulatory protein
MTHLGRGERSQAATVLAEAVALGYPCGFRWSFFVQGRAMAELLYALVQTGRCRHEAGRLLAEFPLHDPLAPMRVANQRLDAEALIEPLSTREIEVLALIGLGFTNKAIAYKLSTSPNTVRNQTVNIYAKLHVHGRKEAVLRAQSLGLLTTP